ncbi:hypothetical protein GCM10022253_21800 [Sphingomonas endophytica]|uniref:Uncharacterized protein n=1 Tax=Sphingomonas endophytica TaxID=869719 RepID=A0ABR6N406_9SPHN|nr:hypothetical protein [Sphingomonas endophytica]MBB5724826.1 hypothetical protein [Sphingomonas endophytica]
MKTIATAVIASLFAVAPAHAAPKATPTAEPSPAVGALSVPVRNAKTRYCYKTEMTGSRIVSRVCKTRDAWKDIGVIVPESL